ncbi:LacI family DNA-binding transcriptional regulator [Burkholderia gladioli]|uniref:Periplasmic binding s and sugar binding domain of LacI family protein n=2 Tax=Burkholderia gladioli TaxID=28095 RepID=A0AAW3EPX8_BURGA|nr:LacI family DNA-binding transcriptional regulator [Burkholderia gladioli]AJW97371.1 periplasmic binding s and sugar binding domain of LacI family protein [Burkholderia gladioli]ASD78757.1 GntR family transcriptional regulator [Burkholderia gladioli pv. gladioli]AWY55995.1 GntR family transcriptional regulator [Burkholderia gladioli pv. gladioli]KGC09858.1 periplasmic binding s and sugar binding domain of LacI family protein [Burkholderia gladioli]MBU9325876.1 LacI family DNA-binding transcr
MKKKDVRAAPVDSAASGHSVTLIDVARVAGVAPMTVSRALNRPELVRADTQKKVLDAVRATGYVPNLLAGGLASNRSRLVAILVPTITNSIFADTVQAIMDGLSRFGYQTLLGLTAYSTQREEELVEAILGRRPDGIVLAGTLHSKATVERLSKAKLPVVEIWDLTSKPIDMVIGFSHEKVGKEVARHLVGKGYRSFGVVSVDDPRGLRRLKSLKAELAVLGMAEPAVAVMPAPATLQAGREGAGRLLEAVKPDVIVCSSDTLAQGVLAEAASRGLRVPADLAVMGFGDLSTAAQVFPALSTVRIDGAAIGTSTAEALLARFNDAGDAAAAAVRIDKGFTIVERQSA